MCMSSRANWEKGKCKTTRISVSGFGEVFVALDKTSNDLVAIKRVKMVMEDEEIASESKLLKECQSRYIVRYYDVMRMESELWVCMVRMDDV